MTEAYSLHLIFSIDGWHKACQLITENDRVLLLQDAVFLSQQDLPERSPLYHNLFARCVDTRARNIKANPHIEVIDDEQWLELTEHAQNVISW